MDEQLQAQLLAQLKDVQLPPPVSWWPPAIGWWLVALITLMAISAVGYYLHKRHTQNRYRKLALAELNAHFAQWQNLSDDKAYISAANNVLKRVVKVFNPNLVNQFADTWIDALESHASTEFSVETRYALAHQCYQAHVSADISALHSELSHWLQHHKREQLHA